MFRQNVVINEYHSFDRSLVRSVVLVGRKSFLHSSFFEEEEKEEEEKLLTNNHAKK